MLSLCSAMATSSWEKGAESKEMLLFIIFSIEEFYG